MSPWLFAALAAGPLALALFWLASLNSALVEAWYSRGLFAALNPLWARVTGWMPLALAEFALPLLILLLIGLWFVTPRAWLYDLTILSLVLAWFVFGWGLNYQRQPWAVSAGLEVTGGSLAELESLASGLVATANTSRPAVPASWKALIPAAKPALYSEALSWLGIAGIYLPWTAEPLVNVGPPVFSLVFTAAHEAQHQLGWAREDEANFLAWKTLMARGEPGANYSAAMGALPHVAGALVAQGPQGADAWKRVSATLSEPVKDDWNALQAYWQRYQGPVQRVSQAVNDTYLKSQGQSDGVKSYGRMVDLMLAWENSAAKRRTPPAPPPPAP
ncbi:MAG: DUF3810 domain-containing protein [Spirochaetales bacterium]